MDPLILIDQNCFKPDVLNNKVDIFIHHVINIYLDNSVMHKTENSSH